MSLLDKLRNFIEEPPPPYAFEIGPAGLATWQLSRGLQFAAIEGLDRDPDPEILAALLRRMAPNTNGNRRRPATVILPDSAARLSLLDFDTFPRKPEEQEALVRMRMKRTVPFDIETAIVRYQVENKLSAGINVIALAIAFEKLAPYEAAFRNAGFHAGFITTSALAVAELVEPNTVLLKLSGNQLTLEFFEYSQLRLYRGLELETPTVDSVLDILDPSLAFLEDELHLRPARVDFCGLEELAPALSQHLSSQWTLPSEPLRTTFEGRTQNVDEYQAGLLGYLKARGAN
jgi:type IV pilus assembly protein PilM